MLFGDKHYVNLCLVSLNLISRLPKSINPVSTCQDTTEFQAFFHYKSGAEFSKHKFVADLTVIKNVYISVA